MRRLTLLVVFVAFTFSCGGQWVVLQGIAWANMIREYSQDVSLHQAVAMTLSGDHPCPLCKAIAEKKQAENTGVLVPEKYDKKFCTDAFAAVPPFPMFSEMEFVVHDEFFLTRSEAPPTPPPRLA